jgi:hypothetical protein
MRGSFKLDQHKNVNKGIKSRGPVVRKRVEYLLSIRPPNASGPIHANPETGRPYVDPQPVETAGRHRRGNARLRSDRQEGEVALLRSRSSRRAASQLSEQPALPFLVKASLARPSRYSLIAF